MTNPFLLSPVYSPALPDAAPRTLFVVTGTTTGGQDITASTVFVGDAPYLGRLENYIKFPVDVTPWLLPAEGLLINAATASIYADAQYPDGDDVTADLLVQIVNDAHTITIIMDSQNAVLHTSYYVVFKAPTSNVPKAVQINLPPIPCTG